MSDTNITIEREVVMRSIASIKPYVRNPRRNARTVELLTQLIPRVGFNVPLVIDEKGIIVKGHARFAAAIRLGMAEVPCIITHADEEMIKADRIADNKISEFSEWITSGLVAEINAMEFDLSDLGLPKIDLDGAPSGDVLSEAGDTVSEPIPSDSDASTKEEEALLNEFESQLYYKCVCDKCGYVMFFKEGEIE